MQKILKMLQAIIFPIVMVLSVGLYRISEINLKQTLSELLPNSDYKLKFVDSTEVELGLSSAEKIILPIDILSVEEKDEWINLTTYENSIIYAPLDVDVTDVDSSKQSIELKLSSLTIVLKNVITGLSSGAKVKCGEVVGSVNGSVLKVKVLWGKRVLSLEEIRDII